MKIEKLPIIIVINKFTLDKTYQDIIITKIKNLPLHNVTKPSIMVASMICQVKDA